MQACYALNGCLTMHSDKTTVLQPAALWQFSLHHYARPHVADVLLTLQDQHQANINLVLVLLWCAQQPAPLSYQALAALHHSVGAYNRHYTTPVRQHRRQRKAQLTAAQYQNERDALLAHELNCEQQEQHLLCYDYRAQQYRDPTAPCITFISSQQQNRSTEQASTRFWRFLYAYAEQLSPNHQVSPSLLRLITDLHQTLYSQDPIAK